MYPQHAHIAESPSMYCFRDSDPQRLPGHQTSAIIDDNQELEAHASSRKKFFCAPIAEAVVSLRLSLSFSLSLRRAWDRPTPTYGRTEGQRDGRTS